MDFTCCARGTRSEVQCRLRRTTPTKDAALRVKRITAKSSNAGGFVAPADSACESRPPATGSQNRDLLGQNGSTGIDAFFTIVCTHCRVRRGPSLVGKTSRPSFWHHGPVRAVFFGSFARYRDTYAVLDQLIGAEHGPRPEMAHICSGRRQPRPHDQHTELPSSPIVGRSPLTTVSSPHRLSVCPASTAGARMWSAHGNSHPQHWQLVRGRSTCHLTGNGPIKPSRARAIPWLCTAATGGRRPEPFERAAHCRQ